MVSQDFTTGQNLSCRAEITDRIFPVQFCNTPAACLLLVDVCDQPKDTGPCYAAIPVYYYDQMSQECRVFTYGGCAGNDNRFTNKEECENRCKPKTEPEGRAMNDGISPMPIDI